MSIIIKTNEKISVKTLSEPYFIIDGSNVAFENKSPRNKPLYSNIQIIGKKLIELEISCYKVICDNNLRYCITERNEYLKAVHKKQIIESPKGTEADIFILQLAQRKNAYMISNDKFKDYYSIFDKKWIESMRISFRIIDDEIIFDRLIANGGERNG